MMYFMGQNKKTEATKQKEREEKSKWKDVNMAAPSFDRKILNDQHQRGKDEKAKIRAQPKENAKFDMAVSSFLFLCICCSFRMCICIVCLYVFFLLLSARSTTLTIDMFDVFYVIFYFVSECFIWKQLRAYRCCYYYFVDGRNNNIGNDTCLLWRVAHMRFTDTS